MEKKALDYVGYSTTQLESYVQDEDSCVDKINHDMHIDIPPWALQNLSKSLKQIICTKKIGLYDNSLDGIVLGVANIKVITNKWAIRQNSPDFHVDIRADWYVFRPKAGAILKGIVKRILHSNNLSVLIYKAFNVFVRTPKLRNSRFSLNQEITIRLVKFDLKGSRLPHLDGELVIDGITGEDNADSGIDGCAMNKSIKFEHSDEEEEEKPQIFIEPVVSPKKEKKSKKRKRNDSHASNDSSFSEETVSKVKVKKEKHSSDEGTPMKKVKRK